MTNEERKETPNVQRSTSNASMKIPAPVIRRVSVVVVYAVAGGKAVR